MKRKRLRRNLEDAKVAGICSGFSDFLEVDSVLIRLGLIIFTLFGGSGILLYIIAWIVIPVETELLRNEAESEVMGTDLASSDSKINLSKNTDVEDTTI